MLFCKLLIPNLLTNNNDINLLSYNQLFKIIILYILECHLTFGNLHNSTGGLDILEE